MRISDWSSDVCSSDLPLMNLGDVRDKTVPKMTMVSPPSHGGCVSTRTFIPHRCHATIGVFGAISVATACLLPGSPAAEVAAIPGGASKKLSVEHPTGALDVIIKIGEAACRERVCQYV